MHAEERQHTSHWGQLVDISEGSLPVADCRCMSSESSLSSIFLEMKLMASDVHPAMADHGCAMRTCSVHGTMKQKGASSLQIFSGTLVSLRCKDLQHSGSDLFRFFSYCWFPALYCIASFP